MNAIRLRPVFASLLTYAIFLLLLLLGKMHQFMRFIYCIIIFGLFRFWLQVKFYFFFFFTLFDESKCSRYCVCLVHSKTIHSIKISYRCSQFSDQEQIPHALPAPIDSNFFFFILLWIEDDARLLMAIFNILVYLEKWCGELRTNPFYALNPFDVVEKKQKSFFCIFAAFVSDQVIWFRT